MEAMTECRDGDERQEALESYVVELLVPKPYGRVAGEYPIRQLNPDEGIGSDAKVCIFPGD